MNNFGRITLAALAVLTAGSALAQTDSALNNVTLNVGGSYPLDRDLRNATSDFGWHIGAEYRLPYNTFGDAGTGGFVPSIGVTYGQTGGSTRYSFWAAELIGRTVPEAGAQFPIYFGAALGAYWNEFRGGGMSDRSTRFGGRLFLGTQVSTQARVEAGFRFAGSSGGTNTNAVFVNLGFNF